MDYNLEHHLDSIYSRYPEGCRKPVVGITANHKEINTGVRDRYCQQVLAAGGVPIIIPPSADADVIIETLTRIDALLLTGGADHDPRWMGEEPSPLLGNVNEVRDLPELLITRLAFNRQMPILGICRGMQTVAVALGGHVAQDISLAKGLRHIPQPINHSQEEEREVKTHEVAIERNSTLFNIYNKETLAVNSFHHQAVDSTGTLFRPTAFSPDGLIEAMESTEHKAILAVQWHPEWLAEEGKALFSWLVDEARLFSKAKEIHRGNLVIDSHCDTPMFFPQGADFSRRDEKILVDLHKMTDGLQDVATMVAYIPQPAEGQAWSDVAPFPTDSPKAYADLIFDKMTAIINAHPEHLAQAWDFQDAADNARQGKKSIMFAIENALALGGDLDNVRHFASRGAVYFTLCHNGDNQICDSARRSLSTWGGVSRFGEQVIAEMNRYGVAVDLSHAGEKSFYDALQISKAPAVCSHSNCYALCPHERNLTDDQLRALAKADGVCQITLYGGFLAANPSEADILNAMEHLNHAVKIMGIEHVGLGSDFDGDGGVPGMKDSSEMILFTRQLLKNRYSDDDIALIWGGNWMRTIENNILKSNDRFGI